jgi:hypothetical protein
MKGCGQPRTAQPEPRVGIFWLIGQRLVIDAMPLSKASKYGDCKIYEGDHITLWSEMEKCGEVPRDTDYEEPLADTSITTRRPSGSLCTRMRAFCGKRMS